MPFFLHRVSRRVGDFWALSKVQLLHDLFMLHAKKDLCSKADNERRWHVIMCVEVTACDDLMWACDCHFFSTYELPCMHLILISREGHGFDQLSMTTDSER